MILSIKLYEKYFITFILFLLIKKFLILRKNEKEFYLIMLFE